ncbi:MAG TPA: substrate-binding domain-containing protein, partial [Anaeromyxobacter sp.]|nr:substrate-binding domain-containing protein [Anaeromyxobacter sp.]
MLRKVLFALLAATALPLAAHAAPLKIGMSVPGLQFPFFVIMKNDAEKAAAKLGATIVFADAQNDSAKQAADIENFVAQKVDAILVSPMTVDSQVPAIEAAVKAGIPVATVDRKSNSDMVLVHVGADNVQGGRAAAKYVIDQLHNKGSVIELEGTPGASAAIDRKKGFDEVIQKSGVKLLVSQTAEFTRAKGQNVMEALIQKYPNFDAVFGANDEMIIGAVEAMAAANVKGKVTIGFDATPDAFQYMKEGKLGATIDQFPGKQAGEALKYLVDYVKTKKKP